MDRVRKVGQLLADLRAICDTGFALAIHIRFTRPLLLYQTYPQEWSDFYDENGLLVNDPVARWGIEHTGVCRWDDPALEDPAGVFELARRHGLENGVAISTGPKSSRTISGHTRSNRPFTPAEIDRLRCLVETLHQVTEGLGGRECHEMQALRAFDFVRSQVG